MEPTILKRSPGQQFLVVDELETPAPNRRPDGELTYGFRQVWCLGR
jgi:hypothetical protein